jgi:MYXO-CTERM domain-containing protein
MSPRFLPYTVRKPMLVAALACLPFTSAQAFDADLGLLTPSLSSTFQIGYEAPMPTFVDELSFDLTSDVTASFSAKGQGFSIPGLLTLTGSPDITFAVYKGGSALTGFDTMFTDLSLVAGTDYAFMVKGSTGGYTVTWSTSPVPEPGTVAFAVAGLAVAGSLRRRRTHRG